MILEAMVILIKRTYTYTFRNFQSYTLEIPQNNFKDCKFSPQGQSVCYSRPCSFSQTLRSYNTYTYTSEMLGNYLFVGECFLTLTLTL